MARHHVVRINRPMLEALKKLIRSNVCPVCNIRLYEHSSVTLDSNGKVVGCSIQEGN